MSYNNYPDSVPCRRYDQAGAHDPRLVETLSHFSTTAGIDPSRVLLALYDHEDRLWATWHDESSRSSYGSKLSEAWYQSGGTIAPIHLLNVEEEIEFDEDDLDASDPD